MKPDDIVRLKQWLASGNDKARLVASALTNLSFVEFGSIQTTTKAKDLVSWRGFFERLHNAGLVDIVKSDNEQQSYKLNDNAIQYIETIESQPASTEETAALYKRKREGRTLVYNTLFVKDLENLSPQKLLKTPSSKFWSGKIMLYSTKNPVGERYVDGNEYQLVFPYDTNDDGLIVSFQSYKKININRETLKWTELQEDKITNEQDVILEGETLALVPFYEIMDIEEDGDSWVNYPVIHCCFNCAHGPFLKFYIKLKGCNIYLEEGKELDAYKQVQLKEYVNSANSARSAKFI